MTKTKTLWNKVLSIALCMTMLFVMSNFGTSVSAYENTTTDTLVANGFLIPDGTVNGRNVYRLNYGDFSDSISIGSGSSNHAVSFSMSSTRVYTDNGRTASAGSNFIILEVAPGGIITTTDAYTSPYSFTMTAPIGVATPRILTASDLALVNAYPPLANPTTTQIKNGAWVKINKTIGKITNFIGKYWDWMQYYNYTTPFSGSTIPID